MPEAASKSWANAYLTEQREPHGVQGGGRWTSGMIGPPAAGRHGSGGRKPPVPMPADAPAGTEARMAADSGGGDSDDARQRAEAQEALREAAEIETQIDHLKAELKSITRQYNALTGTIAPGKAPGASTGQQQSNTAAAAQQAAASQAAWQRQVNRLTSQAAQIRSQISQLTRQRAKLLARAAALLHAAQKNASPDTRRSRVTVLAPESTTKAATVTGEEIVHAGLADITKWEEGPDGTLFVYGRATTPEVDTDEQIVDSTWSGEALKSWLAEAPALRVQHNGQRDPAGSGVGVEIDRDGDGAHWIKAAVDEPVAQRLVKKQHLRAFSVGIAKPVIERDVTGKARGGVIKGGRIVEVSLVDSPANRSCFLEIAKAAGEDGHAEFTGKVVGGDVLTKTAKTVTVELPKNMSMSIKPSDLAKLQTLGRELAVKEAATKAAAPAVTKAVTDTTPAVVEVPKRDFDPDVGGGMDRDRLPASDFVFPKTRTFPVVTAGDVSDAVSSWGRYKGSEPFATFKKRLTALARRKGFTSSLPAEWKKASTADALKVTLAQGIEAGKLTQDEADAILAPVTAKAAAAEARKQARRAQAEARKAIHAALTATPDEGKKIKVMCPGCGAKQNIQHKHCPECGQQMPPNALQVVKNHDFTCLSCGKNLDKGEKHCPQCGKENPGYLPEADRKIPSNQGKSGKDSVAKGKKKGKGKTPASASGAAGEHGEKPAGPHREPDGPVVEAFERSARMEDGDSEKAAGLESGTLKSAKGKKKGKRAKGKKKLPPWLQEDGSKDSDGDGDDDKDAAAKSTRADDPELLTALRCKSLGVPLHMGAAHDLTCPAFLPAEADLCYPGASLTTLDMGEWQADALEKAAGGTLEEAQAIGALLEATMTLRNADPLDLADIRDGAHKMFREVNPGPAHFPTPAHITPERFHRPYIHDGHAAPSPGHDGPHHAQLPPADGIQPGDYRRGYLSGGRADESPANTHSAPPSPAPDRTGVPTTAPSRVFYRNSVREGDEHAMRVLHDHIAGRFPALCPMHPHFADKPVPVPQGVPLVASAPGTAGLGSKKAAKKAAAKAKRKAAKARAALKAKRRKLEAKVLKGTMTVEQARQKLGLQPVAPKGAPPPPVTQELQVDAGALQKALAAAVAPLAKKVASQDKLLRKQRRAVTKARKLAKAAANAPDTSQAPFRGTALTKQASTAPAGTWAPGSAEQAPDGTYARLYNEWATTTDPAAQAALARALAPYWNPAMTAPGASASPLT